MRGDACPLAPSENNSTNQNEHNRRHLRPVKRAIEERATAFGVSPKLREVNGCTKREKTYTGDFTPLSPMRHPQQK
jgi:hypothetical protein